MNGRWILSKAFLHQLIGWYDFCCSITKSCLTLCNPMNCSMPVFSVLHCLPEFAQTDVHWVDAAISSSVTPFSSCLQSFPASGSFPMGQLFSSGSQSTGASASESFLPMNIQCWFSLALTGLISLLSKELWRVFFSTTVQKHQFFGTQLSSSPTLTCIHDHWKNHSLD